MFGLQKIIESPTHATCTSLIDHICKLALVCIFHNIVSLMRVYLTITLSTALEKLIETTQGVHKHIGFYSFEKYTVDAKIMLSKN